jgi:tetratricopeptide (TPR) repeat protein
MYLTSHQLLTASFCLSMALFLPSATLAKTAGIPLWQQAKQAETAKDYRKAEAIWQQISRQQPTAEAYYHLGLSQHRQFKFLEAIATYQNSIRLDPKYSQAYINLGLAQLEIGQSGEATKTFQQAIALPDQPAEPATTQTIAHYNLAIIFNREGKPDQARQQVEQALALTPQFTQAQELLKQLKPIQPNP